MGCVVYEKKATVDVIMLFIYNFKIIGDLNSIQGLSTSSSFEPLEIDTHVQTKCNRIDVDLCADSYQALFSSISHASVFICIAIYYTLNCCDRFGALER